MHGPIRDYDALLADIKCQISKIKSNLSPTQAMEMCNEVQSHLNRVMADIQEMAGFAYDADEIWSGTIYDINRSDPEDQTQQW